MRWTYLLLVVAASPAVGAFGGPNAAMAPPTPGKALALAKESGSPATNQFIPLSYTTKAYRQEALRLLIQEANLVAQQLQLPEKLPITESDLVEAYISPYGTARALKAIGNVTTTNYSYSVSRDNKFSHLGLLNQDQARSRWIHEYAWPITRLDTMGAYQLATQWLASLSVDVDALGRDCHQEVTPCRPQGGGKNRPLVPLYWVTWFKANHKGSVAFVELLAPTKTIVQLCVEDPKYIRRKPLEFTNLDALLVDTNRIRTTVAKALYDRPRANSGSRAKPGAEFPRPLLGSTEEQTYRKGAVDLLVAEANRIVQELGLPEKTPITADDLVQTYLMPPWTGYATNGIGTIATENFGYGVGPDNKLCYVKGMHQQEDIWRWDQAYSWPLSRFDPRGAYSLATQWLAAASIDVAALNHDCRVQTSRVFPVEGRGRTARFLPVYEVYWKGGSRKAGLVVSIDLFYPTKTLMRLKIDEPRYIKRPALLPSTHAEVSKEKDVSQ